MLSDEHARLASSLDLGSWGAGAGSHSKGALGQRFES